MSEQWRSNSLSTGHGDFLKWVMSDLCAIECAMNQHAPMEISKFGGVHLKGIDVLQYAGFGSINGRRGPRQVRDGIDAFLLAMPVMGNAAVARSSAVAELDMENFAILSTAKPFECAADSGDENDEFATYMIKISGPMLRQRIPCIEAYCNQPLPSNTAAGKILKSLFESALANASYLSELQAHQFSSMLIDAVANATVNAPELALLQQLERPSARGQLFTKAAHYIDSHLSDHKLDSAMVAEHCRVSTRYLRYVFASAATTGVAEYIREARLQRCQTALRDVALRHHSIIDIAMTWGFNDPAHFSHLYRRRFGMSPSEARKVHAERYAS